MAKRVRNIIICIIIWLLIVCAYCVWKYVEISRTEEYTVSNRSERMGDAWYVTDNNTVGGIIWRIADNYKAEVLFTAKENAFLKNFYIDDIDQITQERLSAVFSRIEDDNGVFVTRYCVAEFNEALQLTAISPVFRFPQELKLTGFDADEENAYLSALSDNGQQAYVYALPASAMMRINENNKDELNRWRQARTEVSEYFLQECVWPRYFVEAEYANDTLNLRYDDSEPGYFAISREAKDAYENMDVDVNMLIRASGIDTTVILLAALIGCLVIILMSVIFRERRRVVYAVAALEIFMLVICAGSVMILEREYRRNAREEHIRYTQLDAKSIIDGYALTDLNDERLYETSDYEVLSSRIRRRITGDGAVSDVLLVNTISGRVIVSASGMNRGYVGEIFGSSIMDMMQAVANGDSYAIKDISDEGEQMTVTAVNLAAMGHADMAVIYRSEGNTFFDSLLAGLGEYINLILILFAAGTIVGIIFLLMQSADLLKLQNALGELAKGGDAKIDKPAVVGRDMNYMWNSIMEICKNVANNNRIKFLTYEAYFRFAPKSIERILNRQSITEVHGGDMSANSGAIACLMIPGRGGSDKAEIEDRNALMSITEECREDFDGIFISHDSALTEMKYLFLEDNTGSAAFATELISKLREERGRGFANAGMLLHYAAYVYGVAGDARQAAVYLSSDEYDLLMKYIPWLAGMRLGVVATEALLEHENFKGESRYIGFILPDPDDDSKRIKLYELLEAETPQIRSMRNANKPRFEEALRMFYEKDFYIARSKFSEVLKGSPDDELSKWYLFECERCLNDENAANGFIGNLHL